MRRVLKRATLAGLAAGIAVLGSTSAQAQQRTFDVPAQEAVRAIPQFARQAGVQIIAPADQLGAVRTPAVQGSFEIEAALDRLLSDTGLEVASRSNRTIVLRRSAQAAEPRPDSLSPASALNDSNEVEEVIVTAQRREERGQDVPIAVTAYGARAIDDLRLETLRDVSRLTPGLLVSAFNQSSPTIAIRAANNTFTQIGANKPVAVVVDDVFIPRNSAASFELFELNSIQVLKGPQGTLFGRNVTGGVIVLDTGRPAFGADALNLRATLGDYGARSLDALADIGSGERSAFRVTTSFREREGFGSDRLTGREQDDLNSRAIRVQGRFAATPTVEVLVGADYAEDENGGRTLSSIAQGNDGDRRTSELGIPQRFDRNQWGASARLYWDVLGGELTSITAYRESQSGELFSGVGANFAFLTTSSQLVTDDADHVGAFTQELRFASPRWERGRFIVGLYYSDEAADRIVRTQAFAARTGALVTDQVADQTVDSRSFAVFADGTLALPYDVELTVGARYTADEKTASLVRTDFRAPAASFAERDLKADWSEVTPRAILSWSPTADLLAYASYARGYTAGGFNTDAAVVAALRAPFDPETVDNYEIGVKSDWLDRRLRVNAAVFRLEYKDKQELFFNNITRVLNITNAAEATVEGFEIETRVIPVDWLVLNATYGRLDSEYDAFVIPGGAVFTGNPLGSSPDEKISFSAEARAPLGGWGEAFATAVYSRTSDYFTGASADPNLRVPAYDLVNLSVGVEPEGGTWRLTAFVRNLEDTEYLLTPSIQTVRAEYLGEPRTAGLTLDLRF